MTLKIINLCPVCGGKGTFLMQRCMSCGGCGGEILKYDTELTALFERNRGKLSEQEIGIFQLYKSGSSHKEIAKRCDLSITQLCTVFYHIEKKLNS